MKLTILFVILLTCVNTALAQTKPYPDIPDGTKNYSMGQYLEDLFQRQLGVCINGDGGGKKALTIKEDTFWRPKTVTVTAIPNPLYNEANLQLNGTVRAAINSSAARLLGYVYPKEADFSLSDEFSFLDVNPLEDPATMLPGGKGSILYTYSCSSNIAWSMKVNSGYKFPIAEISSALQADTSNSKVYQLVFVYGTFKSPLWKIYKTPESTPWKTYAEFLIWHWYLDHAGAATDGKDRFLLTQFDGASVYRLFQQKQDTSGKVNVSGDVGIPVVSLNTSLQGTYNNASSLRIEDFGVVVRQNGDKDIATFEPLPSAKALVTDLSGLAAHLDKSPGRLSTGMNTHTQLLRGVPNKMCDDGIWTINPKDSTQSVTLSKPVPVPTVDSQAPGCQFPIIYNETRQGNGRMGAVTLEYSFSTTLAGNTITVKADPVSLTPSGLPKMSDAGNDGLYKPETRTVGEAPNVVTFRTVTWNFNFNVQQDPDDKLTSIPLSPTALSLTCGTRTIENVSGELGFDGSSKATLKLTHSVQDKENLDLSKTEQCSVTGNADVKLASGAPFSLAFSTVAFYYATQPISSTGTTTVTPPTTPR